MGPRILFVVALIVLLRFGGVTIKAHPAADSLGGFTWFTWFYDGFNPKFDIFLTGFEFVVSKMNKDVGVAAPHPRFRRGHHCIRTNCRAWAGSI